MIWFVASKGPSFSGVTPSMATSSWLSRRKAMPDCGEDPGEAVGFGCAGPHDHACDASRDLVERALRLQLAKRHDDRVVDGLCHLGQQVGRDEHRAALAGEVAHEVAQPGDALGIEPVGRLVEDEDVGVPDEGGGQLQALAHAHGEATDLALGVAGQADEPSTSSARASGWPPARAAIRRCVRARRAGWKLVASSTAPTVAVGFSRSWYLCPRWSPSRRRGARGPATCAASSSCPTRWGPESR